MEGDAPRARGFIVHSWAEPRKNRLCYAGRLEDGRSFGFLVRDAGRSFHVRERDLGKIPALPAGEARIGVRREATLEGEPCAELRFDDLSAARAYAEVAARTGIVLLGSDRKPEQAWLIERGLRLGVAITGIGRPGKKLDAVWVLGPGNETAITADSGPTPELVAFYFDIETSRTDEIRAIGIECGDTRECLFLGDSVPGSDGLEIRSFPDERQLLGAFSARLRVLDPDILIGWNSIDFDLAQLSRAFERNGLPFDISRTDVPAKYFGAEGGRSASLYCQGRQALDAMRLVRGGDRHFEDLRLETVAREILGEGKSVAAEGEDKLAELDRLYRDEPAAFCAYCHRDAALARRIMEKTGLLGLTVARAALTGAALEQAWTSIASFERVYATGLAERGIVEPPEDPGRKVSGAAGGTILDPEPGIHEGVAVLDFRSLYPSIIRTFNIDPLAHARAGEGAIVAPNGATFSRGDAVLPDLIADYTERRAEAISSGDANAAFVYKILMNSFYGVMGTERCRYGLTELAGAITSFAKKFLRFSRDFFEAEGYRVLYGDTDSLFILTGLGADAGYMPFSGLGAELCAGLNKALVRSIGDEYGLESHLELRLDKAYGRFFIPRIRAEEAMGDEARGRAKGYAGLKLLPGGGSELEVKGMEAARSDSSPLARRVQRELLALVFSGAEKGVVEEWLRDLENSLLRGELDGELVFRKKLRRRAASYEKTTPPHIRAARMLGIEERGGWVEYLMTTNGPEPCSMRKSPIDYDEYLRSQVIPVARSIGLEAGFDPALVLGKRGQLELGL